MGTAKSYPRVGQAIVLLLLLLLLQFLGSIALYIAISMPPGDPAGIAVVNVLSVGAILIHGIKRTQAPFRRVCPFSYFRPIILMPLVVVVVGLSIILSEVDNATRWFLPMPEFVAEVFVNLRSEGITSLITLMLFAPLTEELLFRGLILRGFLSHYTRTKAVLLSAVLFACLHLNPYQLLAGFCMGVLLAWLFLKTGSLLPCLFAHAFMNSQEWIVVNVFQLDIPGYTAGTNGISQFTTVQFQPLWFDLLGCLLLGTGLILLIRVIRHGDKKNTNKD